VTLVDIRLEPGAQFNQDLPDSYNGFLYVLDGAVSVGEDRTPLTAGQVGWLALPEAESPALNTVSITGGDGGARVMLYAGERQHVSIVQHGPFVGESRTDIVRLSELYMKGRMPRISELARDSGAKSELAEAASGNRN
jgi:hypothetical protein